MFIINDPVGKYKSDIGSIQISPGNGIDIVFNNQAGNFEELLIWTN